MELLIQDRHIFLLLAQAIFGDRSIHFADHNSLNFVVGCNLHQNFAHSVCQNLWDASQNYILRIQRRHIGRQRQPLQLLFQLRLAQQKRQGRTDIVQLRR